jgi:hypothetical protein
MAPPEVIILRGIVASALTIHHDIRGQSHLIPAASEQAIAGHHPTNKGPVFFKTPDTVRRAGGMHRAVLTIDGRNMCSVDLNQKPQGVDSGIHLFLGILVTAPLIPRTLERSSIDNGREKEKKGNEGSYQKNVKIQMPKCQNFSSIRWMSGSI